MALVFVIVCVALIAGVVALRSRSSSATSSASEVQPVPTQVVQSRIGIPVRLGALELTVEAVNAAPDAKRYAPTNTATYAVHVSVRNVSPTGAKEVFVPSSFRLVDDSGATSGIAACIGCPSRFTVDVPLTAGSGVDGWVYLRLPSGKTADRLLYGPMGSTEVASIALR